MINAGPCQRSLCRWHRRCVSCRREGDAPEPSAPAIHPTENCVSSGQWDMRAAVQQLILAASELRGSHRGCGAEV
jgi:hypothetical protein